jgi:hypothetical protein
MPGNKGRKGSLEMLKGLDPTHLREQEGNLSQCANICCPLCIPKKKVNPNEIPKVTNDKRVVDAHLVNSPMDGGPGSEKYQHQKKRYQFYGLEGIVCLPLCPVYLALWIILKIGSMVCCCCKRTGREHSEYQVTRRPSEEAEDAERASRQRAHDDEYESYSDEDDDRHGGASMAIMPV